MNLSFQKLLVSLTVHAEPQGTNVNETKQLGLRQAAGEVSFVTTAPDIFYQITVVSTGAGDVATLDLTDGTVAQTTGTPTITKADGTDWEGIATATPASGQVLVIRTDDDLTGTITVASSHADNPDKTFAASKTEAGVLVATHPTMSGTVALTFAAAGDTATFYLLAKS